VLGFDWPLCEDQVLAAKSSIAGSGWPGSLTILRNFSL
jgi:hypothetical protein